MHAHNFKKVIVSDCAVHGNDKEHFYSVLCQGYVCRDCVKEGFFIENIEEEMLEEEMLEETMIEESLEIEH
jgi:hypothetical protein